jgi:hypothetical protein
LFSLAALLTSLSKGGRLIIVLSRHVQPCERVNVNVGRREASTALAYLSTILNINHKYTPRASPSSPNHVTSSQASLRANIAPPFRKRTLPIEPFVIQVPHSALHTHLGCRQRERWPLKVCDVMRAKSGCLSKPALRGAHDPPSAPSALLSEAGFGRL